jgi:hypothetical protein
MTRIASRFGSGAEVVVPNRQLVALGAILGLAALTRSEAIWLGLAWLAIVWRGLPRRTVEGSLAPATAEQAAIRSAARRFERLRLALMPGAVATLVFVPWAVRDWLTFGSPLPGQTLNNALYVSGFDIFAYRDQPSLAGYLSQGPAAIIGMHVDGLVHNLLDVLVIPAFPLGLIGLLVLPRVWRLRSLRPLVLTAFLTFAITSLLFPVSTQSGTFLHSAGAVLVLLIVSCLAAFDALIVWVGRLRHWTRPVAWLGPAFAIAAVVPLTGVSVSAISRQADEVRARYEALPAAMARAGVPLGEAGPVITNFPIWLAESARIRTLALPEEPPGAVLDLAHRFGATLIVIQNDDLRQWPGILDRDAAAAACFKEVPLTDTTGGKVTESSPLAQMRAFRIVCP